MTVDYIVIGKRIREARLSRGWTQAVLAEKSGVEPSNISHIERGATKLSLPTLLHIANALGTTLDMLVYGNLTHSAHVSVSMINEAIKDCTDEELRALTDMIHTTKALLRRKH